MSNKSVKTQGWIVGILGLWFVCSAFINFTLIGSLWHNIIVGAVVLFTGVTVIKERMWQAWISILIGVWLIIAAFIPLLNVGMGLLWNNLISGSFITIAGFAMIGKANSEVLRTY
jgi:hypothetical protein